MAKKILISVIAIIMLLQTVTACSSRDYSHIEGYSDIENARKLYAALYSADLTVTDASSDTVTQRLSFMYDNQDRLMYSYFGTDGKTSYYEYHDGYEYSYYDSNAENPCWITLTETDENYVCYNKVAKMSMTTEGMIFIKGESITDAKVTATENGKEIVYTYNAEQLNSSMTSQLGLVGQLKEFKVTYTLNSEGYCTKMQQTGKAELDGKESEVDYILEIKNMNDVSVIEKPEIILR